MKLKVDFRTPQEDFDDKTISFNRCQKHWDEIQANFTDLESQCSLMMDDIGKTVIRAFITCPTDISDKDTRAAIHWMKSYFGNVERNFREQKGTFFWKSNKELTDEHGRYDFIILLENTHPLTCEIKKVKKEVEIFESICK